MLRAVLAFGMLAAAWPALAETPTEVVKQFYTHAAAERDPTLRSRFAEPALTILNGADQVAAGGQGDCLDPNMAIDGADFGPEITSSLKTLEAVAGDTAKVVVAFTVADTGHRLQWTLVRAGESWKVSDLISVTGEWALSQYNCQ